MRSRIEAGTGYRVHELQIPQSDWMVLNEIAREIPEEFLESQEGRALDWLEDYGSEFAYALSPELHDVMNSVIDGDESSVLLIATEDPGDEIGITPSDHLTPSENKLYQPDLCRGVLIGAFGLHGYGFKSQQYGVIFNNLVVAESQRDVPLVASSLNPLGLHTEDSAFADGENGGISPDVLSLHYFRNLERVSTPVSVPDFDQLDDRLIDELCMPQFYIPNSNAQGGDENQFREKVPVLFGDSDRPDMRFNAALMPMVPEIQGPKVMNIIEEFMDHIEKMSTTLVLNPGDILFINNRQALHGKGMHKWEAPNGEGRWQRRLALTKDLGRISQYTEEDRRIVNPNLYRIRTELVKI